MEIEEIKKFLKENADNDEVKKLFSEHSKVTVEKINSAMETDTEIRTHFNSLVDTARDKGINSFKDNSLPGLIKIAVDDAVKKANPAETQAEKSLRELNDKFDKSEKARLKEARLNKALSIAGEKKLPTTIAKYFVGDDDEATLQNLNTFDTIYKDAIKEEVEKRFKDGGRTIDTGLDDDDNSKAMGDFTMYDIENMSKEDLLKNKPKIEAILKKESAKS